MFDFEKIWGPFANFNGDFKSMYNKAFGVFNENKKELIDITNGGRTQPIADKMNEKITAFNNQLGAIGGLGLLFQGQQGYENYLKNKTPKFTQSQGSFGYETGGTIDPNKKDPPEEDHYKKLLKIAKDKGVDLVAIDNYRRAVSKHESKTLVDKQWTYDNPKAIQDNGPGRGKYMFEKNTPNRSNAGAQTAFNRFKHIIKDFKQEEWQDFIDNDYDATYLSDKQQDALFLANMLQHPNIKTADVKNDKDYFAKLWGRTHQTQSDPKKMKNFKHDAELIKEGYIKSEYPDLFEETDTYDDMLPVESMEHYKKRKSIENLIPGLNFTKDPKKAEMGGLLEYIPVQTEKGEYIEHLNRDITKVAAKKLHKDMSNDKVTDIGQKGAFVYSNSKKRLINKKDVDIVIGYTNPYYKEGHTPDEVKTINFKDIMNKEEMTPAEIIKRVIKKYNTIERDDDLFTAKTNSENKTSRIPYSTILKGISAIRQEEDKFSDEVPKFNLGGLIGPIISAATDRMNQLESFIPNLIGHFSNKKRAKKHYKKQNRLLNQFGERANQNLNYSTGAQGLGLMANYLTQDPNYDNIDLSGIRSRTEGSYLNQTTRLKAQKEAYRDLALSQSNAIFRNLGDLGNGAGARATALQAHASSLDNQIQMNSQYENMINNTMMNKLQSLNRIDEATVRDRQYGKNLVRSNINQLNSGLTTGLGRLGASYFNQKSNIDNYLTSTKMNLNNSKFNFETGNEERRVNSLSSKNGPVDTNAITNVMSQNSNPFAHLTEEQKTIYRYMYPQLFG